MPDASLFPVLRLPAQRLARAWTAVFNAAGSKKEEYHLYRAITVEVFVGEGGGVRLICSNGSFLLRCWVPQWHDIDSEGDAAYAEPGLDIEPAHTVVVSDVFKRALNLMGFLGQPPVEGEDDGRSEIVELTVGRIESDGPQQLTLDGSEKMGLLITAPRSQECPPLLAGTPTIWRHYYDEFDPGSVQAFGFTQRNLRALGAVKGETGTVEMVPQGDNLPFLIRVDTGFDVVWGVLMPVKKDAPAEVDDIDDPADEVEQMLAATPAEDAPKQAPRRGQTTTVTFTQADAEALAEGDAHLRKDAREIIREGGTAGDVLRNGSGLLSRADVDEALAERDGDADGFFADLTPDDGATVTPLAPPAGRRRPRR